MAWMGDTMGKGGGYWLGQGQNCFVHEIYGEDYRPLLGIDHAMDSAHLRQKCSLGAPYSPRRLRVGAPNLNSAWGWLFYMQRLKENG